MQSNCWCKKENLMNIFMPNLCLKFRFTNNNDYLAMILTNSKLFSDAKNTLLASIVLLDTLNHIHSSQKRQMVHTFGMLIIEKLIDFCNGYGALLLGHRRKEIIDSVSKQLTKGTLYCTPTEAETELAKLIIGNFPAIDKVRLMNTGGEATMTAIRLIVDLQKRKR